MARPIVILHGWSDNAASFRTLGKKLRATTGRDTLHISLADWVSLDDDVTYADLGDAMERAWSSHPELKTKGEGAVDCIVHSTGALVVREWMRRCRPDASPIKHLVMLAPANFGSPLAHHGRSVVGRARNGYRSVKKGKGDRLFETGTRILHGLELASEYTTELALHDLFGARGKRYGPGGVLCSVIVGNEGNQGPLGMLEFDGSDGTVRTSTASLRCRKLEAGFEYANAAGLSDAETERRQNVRPRWTPCTAKTAFLLADGLDHGDVTLKKRRRDSAGKAAQDAVLTAIVEALEVRDGDFPAMVKNWDARTKATQDAIDAAQVSAATDGNPFTLTDDEKHAHHNLVLSLRDTHDEAVDDYVLEIYNKAEIDNPGGVVGRDAITRKLNRRVMDDVHAHRLDASRRCFHLDLFEFDRIAGDHPDTELSISVSARPSLGRRSSERAGYHTFEDEDIGAIRLRLGDQLVGTPIFARHATTLAFFTIERCQGDDLFTLQDL